MNSTQKSNLPIILASIAGAIGMGLFIYFIVVPVSSEFIATYIEPGIGLKGAAVISFFVSIATIVLLAFTGGDGLLGEVQYMIAGFFSFFFLVWILVAWIF